MSPREDREAKLAAALRRSRALVEHIARTRAGRRAVEAREVLRVIDEALPPLAAPAVTLAESLERLALVHLQHGASAGSVKAMLEIDLRGWGRTKLQASRLAVAAVRAAGRTLELAGDASTR